MVVLADLTVFALGQALVGSVLLRVVGKVRQQGRIPTIEHIRWVLLRGLRDMCQHNEAIAYRLVISSAIDVVFICRNSAGQRRSIIGPAFLPSSIVTCTADLSALEASSSSSRCPFLGIYRSRPAAG